jgi:hypothetical protein
MASQIAAPEAPPPLLQVAQGYDFLSDGRVDDALREADAALARSPELVDALMLRGACLKAKGQFAEAIAAFQAGLDIEPNRAAAYVSLANAHAELGDLAPAEAALRQAIALSPRLKAAHGSLISVCAMLRRDDLTQAACEAALAVDPQSVNAHQHLADLHERAGRSEQARRHRDAAYRRQNIFIERATRPAPTALVLLTTEDGNIPVKYLLSRDRYTIVKWLIDYATPDQAARLPRYDVVLNAVADPDVAPDSHIAIERFRPTCNAPFLNRPDRVARTSRTRLPGLLADLPDVVVPPSVAWESGEPLPLLGWPVLIRPVGSHGGEGVVRVESEAEFAEAALLHRRWIVTSFHDFASPDGQFRKYRAIFIDRRPYPYHLAIGEKWLVHYVTTNMVGDARLRMEERRFLDEPDRAIGARAMAALAAIGARLDLDYAGIDFAVLADGSVLVFEANATMVVHPEAEGGLLEYKNWAVAEILAAFDSMAVPVSSREP